MTRQRILTIVRVGIAVVTLAAVVYAVARNWADVSVHLSKISAPTFLWSTLAAARACGVRPVNWTIEAHDWHPDFTPAAVTAKVLREAASGGVIVMHDGGRGAARSIHALEPVLAGLAERGLRAMPLRELWP